MYQQVFDPVADSLARPAGPAMAGGAESDRGFEELIQRREADRPDTKREILAAYAPYLIIIAVFALAQLAAVKTLLANGVKEFNWPVLDVTNPSGDAVDTVFTLNWLPAAGTLLLLSGLLTMLVLKVKPGLAARTWGETVDQLKWAILTVAAVLGLAFRDEPLGADHHAGPVAGGGGRRLRLPVADHRLARGRGDRL